MVELLSGLHWVEVIIVLTSLILIICWYRKVSSVLFGLYCGTNFGFSDSTLGFKSYLDEVYKRTNKDRLAMRGLRVVK